MAGQRAVRAESCKGRGHKGREPKGQKAARQRTARAEIRDVREPGRTTKYRAPNKINFTGKNCHGPHMAANSDIAVTHIQILLYYSTLVQTNV